MLRVASLVTERLLLVVAVLDARQLELRVASLVTERLLLVVAALDARQLELRVASLVTERLLIEEGIDESDFRVGSRLG